MLYVVRVVERGDYVVKLSVRFTVWFTEGSVRVACGIGVRGECEVRGGGLKIMVNEPL